MVMKRTDWFIPERLNEAMSNRLCEEEVELCGQIKASRLHNYECAFFFKKKSLHPCYMLEV